ncbi:MAG TPA: hypothetical protein VIV40_15860, partial [Kofleriaceae bacterium]
MKLFGPEAAFARTMLVLALVGVSASALAQPAAPAPPRVPAPPPPPTPGPTPNEPPPNEPSPPDVPAPNPDAPTPGTEPVPAPTTTATTPPPAPAVVTPPTTNGDNKTATERRLAAAAACNAHEPTCDWMMTFSSLEKLSLRRSLAALGLEIEPSPWDKVVGQIRIYNEDVFAERNWLRFFNHFHVTTRESAIRGELTINEGQIWDDELIAESARRLKDPLYTGVVALV